MLPRLATVGGTVATGRTSGTPLVVSGTVKSFLKGKGTVSRVSCHRGERTTPSLPDRQASTRLTDHLRMEGCLSPGPECKEQLGQGCYATARGQRDSIPDLAIVSRAR